MAETWQGYQEDAAAFFRSLGLDARVNVSITGVRTRHDIDVVVRLQHVGFEVLWLVECKHWRTPVSKLHVMALREIVSDVGADRGILLCETGFQSGALEAANLTNVRLTRLADLKQTAGADVLAMRLRDLYDRVDTCKRRYWDIPKEERIRRGLRPEVGVPGVSSGARIVEFAEEAVSKALRGSYPFVCDGIGTLAMFHEPREFADVEDALAAVEPFIADLERRLDDS